jgi:hypothetical protein
VAAYTGSDTPSSSMRVKGVIFLRFVGDDLRADEGLGRVLPAPSLNSQPLFGRMAAVWHVEQSRRDAEFKLLYSEWTCKPCWRRWESMQCDAALVECTRCDATAYMKLQW